MIKHHFRQAAGPKHTMHFAYRSCGVGCVMQNSVRVDHVEAFVAKRQVLAVRDQESAVSAVKLETMPRDFDRARCQVNTDASRLVA